MAEYSSYEEELGYGDLFKDFVKNFRDDTGRFKYMDRLRRMINFDLQSLSIDFPDLYRYNTDLAEALIDDPIPVLREAGEAIRELVTIEDPEYAKKKKKFIARIYGLFETNKIREIKSEYIGRLVQIEGIVTRMHPIRSRMIKAVFRHEKCGAEFEWPPGDETIGDRIEKPSICPVCGEGGGKFILVKEKSRYIDWQKITLQEKPEDVPGGQMPRSIEVHLTYDLVDSARPGDRVTIVGIPKLEQTSTTSPLYEVYLEANSMRVSEKALEEVTITREDEEKIKELARNPWIREKIIASIAPSIYGHWDLKEAIALLLFGGVPKTMPDGTRIRGDIHVLFVGDPGMAKSLTYSERILIMDENKFIDIKPIGEITDYYMEKYPNHIIRMGDNEETEYLLLEDIGVTLYTIAISRTTLKPEVKKVKALIRHKAPKKISIIKTKKGRIAKITLNHSIMGLNKDKLTLEEIDPETARDKGIPVPILTNLKDIRKRIVREIMINGKHIVLNEDFGYLIGYLYGNGKINHSRNQNKIEISSEKEAVFRKLKIILNKMNIKNETLEYSSKEKHIHKIIITDKELAEWITENLYKKSNNHSKIFKTIPRIAYNAPLQFIKGLIKGLIDSSGITLKDMIRVKIEGEEELYKITLLLSILGIDYNIDDSYSKNNLYYVYVLRNNIHKIKSNIINNINNMERVCANYSDTLTLLLNNEVLNRGEITWDYISEVRETSVKELEPNHYEYVYDISVEDHENFAGGVGLIFLHNSQLLQSASRIAPRAVYTSGKGSTAAGLTAAVVRDSKTGEFFLEAGALVLADGGVAIIDEIDKMRAEDRTAIHEAMEQQVISISKAGIVARLNARASILAAGNPKLGVYIENKPFTDNVNLPPPIISRFDLIFVVKDKPGMERDRRLARYILEAHSNFEKFKPEIDPILLKKYIIYARRYIKPRISPSAKKLIEDFFVFMRNAAITSTQEKGVPPIPITARQLEAIIRIAEAHAKMALKDEVTAEDAAEAIRITMSFLSSVGVTETGEIDAGIIVTGKTRQQIKLYEVILDTIKRLASDRECIDQDTIVNEVKEATKISPGKILETLTKMKRDGLIYTPRFNCYQVVP